MNTPNASGSLLTPLAPLAPIEVHSDATFLPTQSAKRQRIVPAVSTETEDSSVIFDDFRDVEESSERALKLTIPMTPFTAQVLKPFIFILFFLTLFHLSQ